MEWVANLRVDYFENARGKFVRSDCEELVFKSPRDIKSRIYELKGEADKYNYNCDIKIMLIYSR